MRGLVIREPWIGKILAGEKTWEMRSAATNVRGEIALIRKGSGLVVGYARLVDSRPPLDRSHYMDHAARHAIPARMLDEVIANGWVFPWVLTDARPLQRPVAYRHKSGAVTFVTLDEDVAATVRRQIGAIEPEKAAGSNRAPAVHSTRAAPPVSAPASPQTARTAAAAPVSRTEGETKGRALFVFRPQAAQAFGYPLASGGFVVLQGSTAMRDGSPRVKRDRLEREELVHSGVLTPAADSRLYRFATDHEFRNSSVAAGVIKDGNASGPSLWKDETTGITLKNFLDRSRS